MACYALQSNTLSSLAFGLWSCSYSLSSAVAADFIKPKHMASTEGRRNTSEETAGPFLGRLPPTLPERQQQPPERWSSGLKLTGQDLVFSRPNSSPPGEGGVSGHFGYMAQG